MPQLLAARAHTSCYVATSIQVSFRLRFQPVMGEWPESQHMVLPVSAVQVPNRKGYPGINLLDCFHSIFHSILKCMGCVKVFPFLTLCTSHILICWISPLFITEKGKEKVLISPDHFSFPMLDLMPSSSFLLPKECSLTPSDWSLIGKFSYFLFFVKPHDIFLKYFNQ